jgi:hypothetical protein
MNTLKKAVLTLALVLGICGISQAQTAMTYTTLTTAVTAPSAVSGFGQQPYQTTIFVTSVSGINAFGTGVAVGGTVGGGPQYNTLLNIDGEQMAVQTVNATQKSVTVIRGWEGSNITPHQNGAVVIAGPPQFFASQDPEGQCNLTGTLATPVVNVHTGRQWICDATNGNWLPVLSTGSITPAATSAAIQTVAQTFTLNGTNIGEPIQIVVQPAPTSLCPLTAARITATNTVSLYFTVLTAAACTPAAGTYEFLDLSRYTVETTGRQ